MWTRLKVVGYWIKRDGVKGCSHFTKFSPTLQSLSWTEIISNCPQTKLREGNVFTHVCYSVHRGYLCPGVSLSGGFSVGPLSGWVWWPRVRNLGVGGCGTMGCRTLEWVGYGCLGHRTYEWVGVVAWVEDPWSELDVVAWDVGPWIGWLWLHGM